MTKIKDLPPDTSPGTADELPMLDNTADITKRVTFLNLIALVFSNIPSALTSWGILRTSAFSTGITGTSGGTLTPAASSVWTVSALGANATIAAPTGTPGDGFGMLLRIKATGAYTISWNAVYRATFSATLPTTTVSGKTIYVPVRYNAVDLTWDVLSVVRGS